MLRTYPELDALIHDIESETAWEKMLAKQPYCEICGNHIEPDQMYYDDGCACYHTDCLIKESKIMGVVA